MKKEGDFFRQKDTSQGNSPSEKEAPKEYLERAEVIEKRRTTRERLSDMLSAVKQFFGGAEEEINLENKEEIAEEINHLTEIIEKSESRKKGERKGTTILQKLRELPAVLKGGLGVLVLSTEIAAAEATFPPPNSGIHREEEYKIVQQEKELPRPPIAVRVERDKVVIEGDKYGLFAKHNLRMPESLVELGKMFVEPVSFGIKFKVGKDSFLQTKVLSGQEQDPFMFEVDIPYEYAEDFRKASPVDREKMEKDMEEKAQVLLEKILPQVIGFSFFKEELQDIGHHSSKISEVRIDGFASPESKTDIGIQDLRNEKLSELRAENASYVLKKLFDRKGIQVEEIKYRGEGELPLSLEEREKLLEDVYQIRLAEEGEPENEALMELIKNYNDGEITAKQVREDLDRIIGSKRKVSIRVETNEKDYVLVLPAPIFLIAGAELLRRLSRRRLEKRPPAVYVEFISSPEGKEMDDALRAQARKIGKNIRTPLGEVSPFKDESKVYTGEENFQMEYGEEVLKGTPHRRKKRARQKVELDFNPSLPLKERVQALGFLLDRYLRMTPTLMRSRSIVGTRKSFDLINICKDKEALEEFINRVVKPIPIAMTRLASKERNPIHLSSNSKIIFEFLPRRGRTSRLLGQDTNPLAKRRNRVFLTFVSIDGRASYILDSAILANLADQYLKNKRHKIYHHSSS